MLKKTITLECQEQDDEQELLIYVNAFRYYASLEDIRLYIRSKLKYTEPSNETRAMLEEIRSKIYINEDIE